ncbi:hypothetical protein NQ317_005540 [Molorchus minor]|uniref:Uncharacterized protein n=1 Tax=Molorchus minor TaxID=1323400 RepID=A0ABQ9IQS0_9CUCU|nr:hypothetical protein NQ317_005540 [Molorchus minor]
MESEWSETNRPKVLISNPTVPNRLLMIYWKDFARLYKLKMTTKKKYCPKVKGVHRDILGLVFEDVRRCDQLKTVSTMSSGYNHIDVQELKRRGILLGNTPFVLDNAVADVAILLALRASRRLQEGRLAIENDQWKLHNRWLLGQDIAGSTVGIIGLGGIGSGYYEEIKRLQCGSHLYTQDTEKRMKVGTSNYHTLGPKSIDKNKPDFIY